MANSEPSPRATLRVLWCALLLPIVLLGARCPLPGQTYFVSADPGGSPGRADFLVSPLVPLRADVGTGAEPEVVEGDLFRVLAPGLLLNLNAYRGLQVIDLGDATQPRIIGRLAFSGRPVEMYVVGDVAVVLLGGTQSRLWGLAPMPFASAESSRILAVDLSDPLHPALVDEAEVPGSIQTSRLTRQGERAALYVVANESVADPLSWGSIATVASFDVAGGRLAPVGRLELAGSLAAAQATPELLMVARNDWSTDLGSTIALIDIRDPGGQLALGDELVAAGRVQSQFNMDAYRGVVRVVSSSGWGTGLVNHLETFEASDPAEAAPIDAASFGVGESLFATLFLGNRAFAVTYLRVDPFHAFEISDAGLITPRAEFVVSGWNDFFRPAFDDSRLVGIGVDDQAGRTLAVSLYDVSDLANPAPLLARERVALQYSSSEASFDHRAFSVIEDAVAVPGPNGAVETGLVLLPFSGWDVGAQQPVQAVQIFSFSERTLTRRGTMLHGSPVRRSFGAGEEVVANVSEEELALFDTEDPDQPVELGAVELAPSYTDVLRFGDHRARILGGDFGAPATAVELVPAAADPDVAEPVARFELAPGAAVHQTGSLLVSIAFDPAAWTWGVAPESEITVHDLSDPTRPRLAGRLRSDRIEPGYGYGYGRGYPSPILVNCLACILPWPGASSSTVAAIPGGLAFLQAHGDGSWTLDVLDLGDPSAPHFAESVALGAGVEGLGLLVSGSDVWVATKQPLGSDRRGLGSARFFALRVDVSAPSSPLPHEPINVPGELVAIDGGRIFTRDPQWSDDALDTAVVRLVLEPPLARVEAVRWLEDRSVEKVVLDGAGHLVVLHSPSAWQGGIGPILLDRPVLAQQASGQTLTVLDAGSDDLAVLSDSDLPSWVALLDAVPHRAVLRGADGLLVFGLDDPSAPVARTFPSRTWIERIRIEGRIALHAGGRYGIEVFDLDAVAPPSE